MTADHWFLALLSFATLLYVAWSMGRIHASSERIAQMVRDLHR